MAVLLQWSVFLSAAFIFGFCIYAVLFAMLFSTCPFEFVVLLCIQDFSVFVDFLQFFVCRFLSAQLIFSILL